VEKFLTSFISTLLMTPVLAWEFMVAVGIAHSRWWPAIPTIGFWTACLIVFLLFSLFSGGTLTTVLYAKK